MADALLFGFWVGLGMLGSIIRIRNPRKLLFDNPKIQTIVTVLMALGVHLLMGPFFLAVVLLTPTKQICPHCLYATHNSNTICPHCQSSLRVSPPEVSALRQKWLQEDKEPETDDEDQDEEVSMEALLDYCAFFLAIAVVAFGWSFIFVQISEWRFSLIKVADVQLLPLSARWILLALFLSSLLFFTALGNFPLSALYRIFLGENNPEYRNYIYGQYLARPENPTPWITITANGLILIAVVLSLDSYVLARSDEIVVNSLWTLGENHYSYSDVHSMRTSTNPNDSERDYPIHVIEFHNGDQWSSRRYDKDRPPQEFKELMNYISHQSGIPIEQGSGVSPP